MSMNKDFWERIDKLEELAGKATQGEWKYEPWNENINCNGRRIGVVLPESGEYIAAANPAMILEMIAEMRRLEKELDWFAGQKACKQISNGCCCGHDQQYWREAARKAVSELDNA